MKLTTLEQKPNKSICIPGAALGAAGLLGYGEVEIHVQFMSVVALAPRMTALELLKVSEALNEVSAELMKIVMEACGCCTDCQENCSMANYSGGPLVKVDPEALREAGLSEDTKLCCVADADEGIVKVTTSGHMHDLSDVPEFSLGWLTLSGICMDQLNDHLREGTFIYGDE